MPRITLADVTKNLTALANRPAYNIDFIYALLLSYDISNSTVAKLRSGVNNLSQNKDSEVILRGKIWFKHSNDEPLLTLDKIKADPQFKKFKPRYLISSDYNRIVALDTKRAKSLDIALKDIDSKPDFFFGLTGNEVLEEGFEPIADRSAAEKMNQLVDEIRNYNKSIDNNLDPHHLNKFFTRLLFCYFAEDTGVFGIDEDKNIFTSSIKELTNPDGSDLDDFITKLFQALSIESRQGLISPFDKFPYVNGGLFKEELPIPKFNPQARNLIIQCGSSNNWEDINPDIFGSMFQGIVDEADRATHGMHYTSVANIMKVLRPLFLDELEELFTDAVGNKKKLLELRDRISEIKVFDPACGSGNFLIIAYKELRRLENKLIEELSSIGQAEGQALIIRWGTNVSLNNFYGIEITDSSRELAVLSLTIAKHQMNLEFADLFDEKIDLIPLSDQANIVLGNAARIEWQIVCPNNGTDEIYIVGNPPYYGSRNQTATQKEELISVCETIVNSKYLDYIAIWFVKAANYLEGSKACSALVSTNSICQGDNALILWPNILKTVKIIFAYTSFKWANNAVRNAGVTCVIVAFADKSSTTSRKIYTDGVPFSVKQINGYLTDSAQVDISKHRTSISGLPACTKGSTATEGGNLILNKLEYEELKPLDEAGGEPILYRYIGSDELLNGIDRWCIWSPASATAKLEDGQIALRLNRVREFRLAQKDNWANKMAEKPHQFYRNAHKNTNAICVPVVFSEKREYLVCAFVDKYTIIQYSAFAIYNAEPWLFGLISSKMHMAWTRAVAGRLKTDIRYSSTIVYNNFPVRPLSDAQKAELDKLAKGVLIAREMHSEKTLAQLYKPSDMPDDLRAAHNKLDEAVDKLYQSKPFANDEERLACLFKLYESMSAEADAKIKKGSKK